MALKPLHIITVGTLKTPHWKNAAAHYMQRLQQWRQVRLITVKDADAALPIPERNKWEGQKLLRALSPTDIAICMDEKGKAMTSKAFATFLENISENATQSPCFIIGGAFGLDPTVRKHARHSISLGPMTFPHELAHVLLLEQLYRAEAIVRGVPYHHE